MAMKITERLKVEHGVFLFQLDHLEQLVQTRRQRRSLKAVVEASPAPRSTTHGDGDGCSSRRSRGVGRELHSSSSQGRSTRR
jgi:hypothetical protein